MSNIDFKNSILIKVSGPDATNVRTGNRTFLVSEDGIASLSCSGFFINNEKTIIITSSSCFSPFFSVESPIPQMIEGSFIQFQREREDNENEIWEEAIFLGLIKIERLMESLENLTFINNWRMGWNKKSMEEERYELNIGDGRSPIITWEQINSRWGGNEYLVVLALMNSKIENPSFSELIMDNNYKVAKRGEDVTVISSPFGMLSPKAFLNSISQGIISNIVTTHPSVSTLMLTDAECHPGSEGSPVYFSNGKLAGLLLPPLYRRDGHTVELNLVLSWRVILPHLYSFFSGNFNNLPKPLSHEKTKSKTVASVVKKSVVLVSIGSSWGSGVIITKQGHILTSGHLLEPFTEIKRSLKNNITSPICRESIRVRVDYPKVLTWYEAKLIYLSSSHNDVALLQIVDNFNINNNKNNKISSNNSFKNFIPVPINFQLDYKRGQNIYAGGHGLWGPSTKMMPTLTSGVISKIITHKKNDCDAPKLCRGPWRK
eukprot:TRINITY_DN15143_c0_g1_i1.p1 TRINITY_DN15143_c0_g1~~TRINITY_DN15143_c0_g1_i1.p1  ORF type:complete len:488 (-),score=105.72 TRINITY_DN15143_c0_g1_i1:196-1659(-)